MNDNYTIYCMPLKSRFHRLRKEDLYGSGLTFVLIVLIICVSILIGVYMFLCAENEVKMFSDPRYEEHI